MKGRVKEQKGIEYYMQLPYSILLHQVEDEGEKYWIAEIPELPGCKSHGSTVEEAVKSVEEAKKDWITDSLEEREEIPIPVERDRYRGRILVRMSRSLHHALSSMAESEKLSLNQLIVTILAKEVGRLSVLNRVEDKVDRLLDKMSDIFEGEDLRTSSRLVQVIAGHPGQGQYLLAGTAHTLEAPAVAANIEMSPSAFVSTASPFEELWTANLFQQRPAWQQITFNASRAKETESRDAVESKQK